MSVRISTTAGLLTVSFLALIAILGGAWYVHGSPWEHVEIENSHQVLAGPAIYAVPGTDLPPLPNLPDFADNTIRYENVALGISLRVPKSSMNITCAQTEYTDSRKIVERMAPIPVEVWQEGRNIIIGPVYSEKVNNSGVEPVCERTNRDPLSPRWKIEVFGQMSISNMENFLQQRYGKECRYEGASGYPETPAEPMPEQEGVVRLRMKAVDPETIMENDSECLSHLMNDSFLFYAQQKLMILSTGPEPG